MTIGARVIAHWLSIEEKPWSINVLLAGATEVDWYNNCEVCQARVSKLKMHDRCYVATNHPVPAIAVSPADDRHNELIISIQIGRLTGNENTQK